MFCYRCDPSSIHKEQEVSKVADISQPSASDEGITRINYLDYI